MPSPTFCRLKIGACSGPSSSGIFKICFLLAVVAGVTDAQGLTVAPASAAPGEWAVLQISWHSPAGKSLSALQWDARIPSSQLQIPGDHIVRLTLIAADAGKSSACRAHSDGASAEILRCIVSGGIQSIPDGRIALLSLKVAAAASSGPTPVKFEHVLAVGPDLHAVDLPALQTTVTVQSK